MHAASMAVVNICFYKRNDDIKGMHWQFAERNRLSTSGFRLDCGQFRNVKFSERLTEFSLNILFHIQRCCTLVFVVATLLPVPSGFCPGYFVDCLLLVLLVFVITYFGPSLLHRCCEYLKLLLSCFFFASDGADECKLGWDIGIEFFAGVNFHFLAAGRKNGRKIKGADCCNSAKRDGQRRTKWTRPPKLKLRQMTKFHHSFSPTFGRTSNCLLHFTHKTLVVPEVHGVLCSQPSCSLVDV